MTNFDVVIIGGSTAGCYFAEKMAAKGFSVLVLEKSSKQTVSPDYDIFHMSPTEMDRFALPKPIPGDADYAFEFEDSTQNSAFGHFPKPSKSPIIGMHKHLYILRLAKNAEKAGALFIYDASFKSFVFTNGNITGVTYTKGDAEITVGSRLVADCSGIPAVCRCALPDGYGVENFKLTAEDVFFVTLRYITFDEKRPKYLRSDGWLFYKSWIAPAGDDYDALIGIGGVRSYGDLERVFKIFTKNVRLPGYKVVKTEHGRTPYHRPPYSFVANGFIAMGDAACLTKPTNGEGCTSALVQSEIACEVISEAMKDGQYPTRENMWSINKRYIDAQGKQFASLMSMLIGAIKHTAKENEYLFKHDVIFSSKILGGFENMELTLCDYMKMVFFIFVGIISGRVKPSTIKSIVNGLINSGKLTELYDQFPSTPDGFEDWVKKADAIWAKVGKMSDYRIPD